jgi:hypothetical protein
MGAGVLMTRTPLVGLMLPESTASLMSMVESDSRPVEREYFIRAKFGTRNK